ncbi:MAG: glycosyltransferase family 39 protein [Acidobacteriota bacterium]
MKVNIRDTLVRTLPLCALYCFYAAASFIPPMSINDGCHYALLRAIVEERTFCIDDFAHYTNYFDVAVVDGHYFADRPPGNALIAAPFYAVGRSLLEWFHLDARFDPFFYAVSMSNLAAALNVAVLFALLLRLTGSRAHAGFASICFALGSLNWTYANVFFSHALATLLTLIYLLVAYDYLHCRRWWHAAVMGVLAGLGTITEYQLALLVPATAIPLAWRSRRGGRTQAIRDAAGFVAGGMPVLVFFLFYNWSCFKSPFALSYDYHLSTLPVTGVGSAYTVPLLTGLWSILRSREWGLLVWQPVFVPALIGARFLWRANRAFCTLAVAFATAMLLLTSKLQFFWGGGTHDLRYLAPAVSVLFLLYGMSLSGFPRGLPNLVLRIAGLAAVALQAIHWTVIWSVGFRYKPFTSPSLLALRERMGDVELALRCTFPAAAPYWPLILVNCVVFAAALFTWHSYAGRVRA